MQCPTCGAATHVLDTRGVVRRRECKVDPSHRFETTERVSYVGNRPQGRPPGKRALKASLKAWEGLR